jgi:hypothetical protein
MTGTKAPLKIVTSNRTSPAPARAVSPLSTGVPDRPKPKLLLHPSPQPWTGGCSQSDGRALSQSRRLYYADPHKMP